MSAVRIAAVAAHFGRDLDFDLARIAKLIDDARRGVSARWSGSSRKNGSASASRGTAM